MGYTSMCQFHTGWSHFSRQMVTIDYDGVSTHLMIILMIELGIYMVYMGYTSMCQFHTGWSHFSRLMVTQDYDGVSTKIDDDLND